MKKYIVATLIAIVAFISFGSPKTEANPGVFTVRPTTAVSTTTSPFYSHLNPGVSTTTSVVLDSYAAGTNKSMDSAAILLQLTSTSTPATLKWRYEYSQDNIDWYSDDIVLSSFATTTLHVRDFAEHSWVFASSTAVGLNANRSHKMVNVPTPTRFVRVVFYLPPGSPNAALFYQWVGKNQM